MAAAAQFGTETLLARAADGSLAGTWVLDAARSSVRLRTTTVWGAMPVTGTFSGLSGTGIVSAQGDVKGTLVVPAASVDTKNARRDQHLRSSDFFHVDAHPHIVYTATRLTHRQDGLRLTGTLQVRDRVLPLTVPVTAGEVTDSLVRLDAEISIDRSHFGVTWNLLRMASMISAVTIRAAYTRQ